VSSDFARKIEALAQIRCTDLSTLEITDADRHHLFRVLRAREGEEVVLTDGLGGYRFTRTLQGDLEPSSEIRHDSSPPSATLYLSPLKGDRSEWAVAKATELGVSTVVPLLAARLAVRWTTETASRTLTRWRKVADEAMGVARRSFALIIEEPVAVLDVPVEVAVCDFGATASLAGVSALAIGPEGGWDEGEWGPDRRRIGLGETVLRGDTAAVAAATLLVGSRRGWSRRNDLDAVDKDVAR
jgi:16S rRNA (uracil1498-N3)-methyltransferase